MIGDERMPLPVWTKPALVGAGVGAIALAIVGFSFGGWLTGATAQKMASAQANAKVVSAQVPYCVALSNADVAMAGVVVQLKETTSSYKRADLVMDAGWATIPGQTRPDRQIAGECADMLTAAK
jgi:hypothetical protein